jgi:hypothetical protein
LEDVPEAYAGGNSLMKGTSTCSQWATQLVAATAAARSLHNVDWNMIHDKKSVHQHAKKAEAGTAIEPELNFNSPCAWPGPANS